MCYSGIPIRLHSCLGDLSVCLISMYLPPQVELAAWVETGGRHGNVLMQWRFITQMETFGGMGLLCLLLSSPYEPTLLMLALWKGSSIFAEDFVEQVPHKSDQLVSSIIHPFCSPALTDPQQMT